MFFQMFHAQILSVKVTNTKTQKAALVDFIYMEILYLWHLNVFSIKLAGALGRDGRSETPPKKSVE